jgi:A/G-specific adenine glycosylase
MAQFAVDWFAARLLDWFADHGRHDLPWQRDSDAYRVWIAEVMLQQTQVTTVIPYYERFMARFPNVGTLANSTLDDVLHHWTGLGYYARARNLHRTAGIVADEYGGAFPADPDALATLPGIGRSTAGAIAAIAFGIRAAILDGNVKRVLARFHAVAGHPGESRVAAELWRHAEAHTPAERVADYTQAIMDLGATLCTRSTPGCARCPMSERCAAYADGAVARYPATRPRRTMPVRAARMFLLIDPAGRCLLERRPNEGVWGGLWTPPERPAASSHTEVCAELGVGDLEVAEVRAGTGFRHTFTHFHLDIEPVYVRLSGAAVNARADLRWHSPRAAAPIGLSAPAVRLLDALADVVSLDKAKDATR